MANTQDDTFHKKGILINPHIYTSVRPGVTAPIEVQQLCGLSPKRACLARTLPNPPQTSHPANQAARMQQASQCKASPSRFPKRAPREAQIICSLQFEARSCAKHVLNRARHQKSANLQATVPAKSTRRASKRGSKQAQNHRIRCSLQFGARSRAMVVPNSAGLQKNAKKVRLCRLRRPPRARKELPREARDRLKITELGAVCSLQRRPVQSSS